MAFLFLVLILCSRLAAEDVLIADHPAYRSDPLYPAPQTEVVPGLPIVIRAGVVNITSFSRSSSFSCVDPATVRAVLIRNGETAETALPLRRDSACQIDIETRLPDNLPLGPAEAWLYDATGRKYGPAKLLAVPTRIGILNRLDQSWKGMPALARRLAIGEQARIDLTHPARPGELVELRVLGFGVAEAANLAVRLGPEELPVFATQPDPTEPGVHFFRFRMPAAPQLEGCYVPLRIRGAEGESNLTTLPVASGSAPCAHKLRLTEAEMSRLDAGETLPLGILNISVSTPTEPGDIASFLVRKADAVLLADQTGLDGPLPSGCTLSRNYPADDRAPLQPLNRTYDLQFTGPAQAEGPAGQAVTVSTASATGGFDAPPPALNPGEWRLRVTGGAAVEPFSIPFRVPAAWQPDTSESLITLEPGRDIDLTWDPAPLHPADTVSVTLTEANRHRLRCQAAAASGALHLDTALLQETLATATPPALLDRLNYKIQADPAGLQPFRFPVVGGGEGIGLIRVSTGSVTTRP